MANHRIIDVHQHYVPPKYKKMLADEGVLGSGENKFPHWDEADTLEQMDALGIAVTVGSVASPGFYFGDIDFAARLCRVANEESAAIVAGHPKRFGGLVNVPLPDVGAALKELEYGLDQLKLDGVLLLSHHGDRYLGLPEEDEFYAELDRRGAVAVIHPLRTDNLDTMPRFDFPAGMTELPFGTTRALTNMLWHAVFRRFPNIKWVMPHGAGVMPFFSCRFETFYESNPAWKARLPEGLWASLRTQYFDTTMQTKPGPLACIMDVADPEKVLFGSDYPFVFRRQTDVQMQIEGLESYAGFDARQRARIFRDNALKLFPRFA